MIKSRRHPIIGVMLVVGLLFVSSLAPVLAQQNDPGPALPNLIVNGGFEEGFQGEFGVGYGWGGFSNGSALVGWSGEDWDKAIASGQYAQRIEIKNATDRDRYAGIYQTIQVVPGQQYKLTLRGLIRSEEGSISASDYGYRLQYAVDYQGGTTWELLDAAQWQEIPWDEQPLYAPADAPYRLDTFETTLTARSDRLTLYIRGWKKWLNNGTGIYNLDDVSLVGPAPADFQAPAGQAAAATTAIQPTPAESLAVDAAVQGSEQGNLLKLQPPADETTPPAGISRKTDSPLPVSGQGRDEAINYVLIAGVILLSVLLSHAALTMLRRRRPVE